MKPILIRYLGTVVWSLIMLTSCNITRRYEQPDITAADLYRGQIATDTTTLASLPYTEIFRDTILQGLIRQGIAENLDLKIAFTRIQQSQAYYEESRAAQLPVLNGNAEVARSKVSDAQGLGAGRFTQYQVNLASSWEADIWGRLNSSRKASLASLLETEAAAKAIQTSIVSAIAGNYYTLLSLDQQLDITEQSVRNWDTTVTTMRALKEAGRVTEAAVVQSEAQRYAAEVTIPDLKQSIREIENSLSVLVGRSPGAIQRSRLDEQQTLSELQTGVPAQLLSNRPDVQQAEYAYRNAFELTNVSRAAFYPSLSITAAAGLSSLSLADIISPGALAASIGAGIVQPIFNRRLNRTNLAVAQAGQEATLLNFRNTLLIAGQEVSDALSLHQTALDKTAVRGFQIIALQRSVDYTQQLLRSGFGNYIEVIAARQSLLTAELGRVDDRRQQLQATVDLYRSLGGGTR